MKRKKEEHALEGRMEEGNGKEEGRDEGDIGRCWEEGRRKGRRKWKRGKESDGEWSSDDGGKCKDAIAGSEKGEKRKNGREEKIAMGCGTERKKESIKRLGKRVCEKERANPVKRLLHEK